MKGVTLVIAAAITANVLVYEEIKFDVGKFIAKIKHWHDPPPRSFARRDPVLIGPLGEHPITVTPTPPAGNNSSTLPSAVPLILVSTEPGRNSREGIARIGIDARSPQTYGAGALLVNNARLTEIFSDYVILERDGHQVRLYRQDKERPMTHDEQALLLVGGEKALTTLVPSSCATLTDYLRPTPVFNGKQLRGYSLHAGLHSGNIFSQWGLHEGDVLTQIDGQTIQNPDDTFAVLETLTQGAAIQVQIERNDTAQTLFLDGNLIVKARAAHTATTGT